MEYSSDRKREQCISQRLRKWWAEKVYHISNHNYGDNREDIN